MRFGRDGGKEGGRASGCEEGGIAMELKTETGVSVALGGKSAAGDAGRCMRRSEGKRP